MELNNDDIEETGRLAKLLDSKVNPKAPFLLLNRDTEEELEWVLNADELEESLSKTVY
jgi:hypothetical protein